MRDDAVLRVVQLNIGSLLEPGWPDRRHEIVAWLDELVPDVVCFQEVWEDANTPNSASWVAERARGTWHVAFGGDSFDPSLWGDPSLQFGSAILSRWPIEHSDYVRLAVLPDDDPFPAQVPWELLHAHTAGLDLFSTHLPAAPSHGHHRQAQVVAIDDYVRSVRGDLDATPPPGTKRDAMPAVLCGDFNAEPDSDEIRFLCSLATLDHRTTFWQDAWRMAGNGPGHTQDWRTNPIAEAMNINRKRIDYVFVGDPYQRRGGAGRVLSADLAFHESRTGTIASDHAGLVVDVLWPEKPTVQNSSRV